MSVIEFLLIPVALVIGLAFTRFLDGLWLVIDSPNRYWVHSVWIATKIVQPIAYLWALRPLLDGGGERPTSS